MLGFLPKPLIGVFSFLGLLINTLIWVIPIHLAALCKIMSNDAMRRRFDTLLETFAEFWAFGNDIWMGIAHKTFWDIEGNQNLKRSGWYLINSNHRSWVDIFVLLKVFNRRIPYLKFFTKEQLKYFPIFGTVWWALDYPFMKRYSKDYLKKHPEKQGEDVETTKRQCKKFSLKPTAIVNFLEGTRFTKAKHDLQQSPFKHLLKPKAGGIAFTLNVMGEKFQSMLDVTIVYPEGTPNFLDFMCGDLQHVIVRVRQLDIPSSYMQGDYQSDPLFRDEFQQWVNTMWVEKDELIEQLSNHNRSSSPGPW